MFTGIIEGLGEVISLLPIKDGKTLKLSLPFPKQDLIVGHSIAVNGVCLTLTHTENEKGTFFLSPTTANTTNLSRLRSSEKVNLERPLRLNQELGGHILTGHIDLMSQIQSIYSQKIKFSLPEQIAPYLVQKGSVAIDGISLSVTSVEKDHFWVNIIPHTWEHTNLKYRRNGDMVNIETDIIAKHLLRILDTRQTLKQDRGVTREKLQISGFLFKD